VAHDFFGTFPVTVVHSTVPTIKSSDDWLSKMVSDDCLNETIYCTRLYDGGG
jgi:hypothetical protein